MQSSNTEIDLSVVDLLYSKIRSLIDYREMQFLQPIVLTVELYCIREQRSKQGCIVQSGFDLHIADFDTKNNDLHNILFKILDYFNTCREELSENRCLYMSWSILGM